MAELTIQIGDAVNPLGFRDGDIVHAMNDVMLLWRHTLIVTDHRKITPELFFKPIASLAYRCLRATSKWKVEGISATEERVTNLITSEVRVKPANTLEYIKRRMLGGKKAMFGNPFAPTWFEGQRPLTLARLTKLWTDHITARTGLLAADHMRRDYAANHLKRYLIIVTTDFSNARRSRLEEQHMDSTDPDNPVVIRRRKRFIDWRNLPGMSGDTIDQILDRHRRVDIRRDLIRDEVALVKEYAF